MGRMTYGDGALFQRKDRGLWVARLELGWDEHGERKRWEATSKSKAGALEKLRAARANIDSLGMIPDKSTPLGDWLEKWVEDIAKPTLKPRTYADYRSVISKHLRPRLGKVPISQVTPGHVRTLHKDVQADTSLGTANKVYRVLRAALSDAEREGLVARNVAKLVQTRSVKSTRGALSLEDARTLLAHAASDSRNARWLAALVTGARQAECLGLEWDRVDLESATVDLSWQLQSLGYRHGCRKPCGKKRAGSCPERELDVPDGFEYRVVRGRMCLTRPKSSAGIRIIPIPQVLVEALRQHRLAQISQARPFGLVWTDAEGKPVEASDDLAGWYALMDACKLPRIPLHSARHTVATLLMSQGVDVKVVQAIMGHSQAATTQMYQHADLTMARRAVDQLGASIAAPQ